MATPDMQIFDRQIQSDKYINNIQKQYIYMIKNSDCFWTHYTEKTASVFATMNVPPDTKKPIPTICHLKAL